MTDLAIYGVDIGVVRESTSQSGFAWHRHHEAGNEGFEAFDKHRLAGLAQALVADVGSRPVSIGFEAPLFLPLFPEGPATKAGHGDIWTTAPRAIDVDPADPTMPTKAWYANAGAAAMSKAFVYLIWLFRYLQNASVSPLVSTNPSDARGGLDVQELFCWEAFVATGDKHRHDALRACLAFRLWEEGDSANYVKSDDQGLEVAHWSKHGESSSPGQPDVVNLVQVAADFVFERGGGSDRLERHLILRTLNREDEGQGDIVRMWKALRSKCDCCKIG